MKTAVIAVLLSACTFAAQTSTQTDYHDAVLISFKTVYDGADCSTSGTVNAKTDSNGNASGTTAANTSCSDSTVTLYTVRAGDNIFVLRPTMNGKQLARNSAIVIGTLGYGALFVGRKSALKNQLPGAHILIRSQGGNMQVKV